MITACLATMPDRVASLEKCLRSLRPQVDSLRVICHDVTEPPLIVREMADVWSCEPDRYGSAAKLRWANEVDGLYLGCDDDVLYPSDYVETMLRWVRRWKGKAIACCHGRVLSPRATSFTESQATGLAFAETQGMWLNYPGALGIAFDTRLDIPAVCPVKSCEEAWLAVWAQRAEVPIWLVPHAKGWLQYMAPPDATKTIWHEEKSSGFTRRNSILSPIGSGEGWKLHRPWQAAA